MNRTPTHDARAHHAAHEFNTAWGVTMPADLAPLKPSTPFHEPIQGLATREVHEPELFRLYFERTAR